MNNETVLITGASSGIGLEFAKIFASHSYNLVLVARKKEKLDKVASQLKDRTKINIIAADLSILKNCEHLYKTLKKKRISVDILINNAGIGMFGEFSKLSAKKEIQMLNIDITSLTYLTKLFLNDMIKRKKGKILNVASIASFKPIPLMASYSAAKAYVRFFSEALAKETSKNNVQVSVLCPGQTKTEFQKKAGMQQSRLYTMNVMKAEKVAKIGFNGLMKGKRVIVPGLRNKLYAALINLIPDSIALKLTKFAVAEKSS